MNMQYYKLVVIYLIFTGCVNGGCEEPWECNCANGWGGMHCNLPHNTTNFPYPTPADNLPFPRGAQESTGNSIENQSNGDGILKRHVP